MSQHEQGRLKHDLSNRHIQLITLGGAIGTGLFLGVSRSNSQGLRLFWAMQLLRFNCFFYDVSTR